MDAKEETVAVCTIWTIVLNGDKGCDHLFFTPAEVALGEDQSLGDLHHVAQKWRVRCEALENPRDVRASEACAELSIELGDLTGCPVLLDHGKVGGRGIAGPRGGASDALIFRETQ